ncbi:hypothetical protein ACP4OV_014276 [Aristida adscensionis]
MADDSTVTEVSSVPDGWDMLSLTSSVYTSSLFRRGIDPINLPGYGEVSTGQEGTHPGLFMSDVFVFPPSEHENLPIEPELDELNNSTNNSGNEGSCAGNNDDCCHVAPEEIDSTSDENLSVGSDLPSATETTLPDSNPSETHAKQEKDNTCKSDLPCEGWWKRKSTYLLHHIKGVTTVCSVVVAGAAVGFVVMGQRWHQDKWHLHQFHLSVSDESMSRVIGLFSRLKDGFPGGQQLRSMLPTRVLPQQQLSA